MPAIICAVGHDGKDHFFGPFNDGDQATHWGAMNDSGWTSWYWEELQRPSATYMIASTDDIVDFIGTVITKQEDCYVTVDGANWVVPIGAE